jgi:hypothetical protein
MEIEFIFTFHEREQEFARSEITPEILESKTELLDFIFERLTKPEASELVKISCCVYNAGDYKCPDWYIDMNGKYWLDDIEGYRYAKGIKSKVPRHYVLDWLKDTKSTLNLFW